MKKVVNSSKMEVALNETTGTSEAWRGQSARPRDGEGEALLPSLKPAQFVTMVSDQVQSSLHATGYDFSIQVRGRLVKLWRGDDASVHYELAVHEREGQLELGLHMESDAARNLALYQEFEKYLLDFQAELGGHFWLEPWDRGWARLYETEPLWPLDTLRGAAVAARMVQIVRVVEPVCEAILERLD